MLFSLMIRNDTQLLILCLLILKCCATFIDTQPFLICNDTNLHLACTGAQVSIRSINNASIDTLMIRIDTLCCPAAAGSKLWGMSINKVSLIYWYVYQGWACILWRSRLCVNSTMRWAWCLPSLFVSSVAVQRVAPQPPSKPPTQVTKRRHCSKAVATTSEKPW